MAVKTVDINKEHAPLAELLSWMRSGTEIVLAEDDTVARLVPVAPAKARIAGLHQDAMSAREDFDDPLPDTFWTGAE